MTNWLIETMIATSILLLAVLALRGPMTREFGPRAAYLLWLAPALRMILPPLPQGWAPFSNAGFQDVVVVLAGASSLPVQTPAAVGVGAVWPMILMGLWLGGAALFFIQHLASYWAFTRDIENDAEPLFAQGRIRVARSNAVASPIAFGIFGKTIIVPADFGHRFDETEQRLALSHETFHHRRGDLLVNMAALAILSLHWFNPLAHFAHRLFRFDQEAACDDLVLANTSPAERKSYGTALYKSATGGVPLIACAMGTASQLKARLRCIVARQSHSAPVTGMAMMAGLVLVGLATTASGVAAEKIAAPAYDFPTAELAALQDSLAPLAQPLDPAKAGDTEDRATVRIAVRTAKPAVKRNWLSHAEPPAPPMPPAPPAPAEPPAPPAPPAPPHAADPRLANINCPGGGTRALFIHRANLSIGVQQGVSIIVCESDGPAPLDAAQMIATLESVRATLANEKMLTDAQRNRAVTAINNQIAAFQARIDASFITPAT